MSDGRNRRRIRNYLINRTVQGRVVAMNLSFMCIIMILTMAVMILYTPPDVYDSISGTMAEADSARITIPLDFWLYLIIAVTFLFAIVSQIWMTHRVCGSLVNFTNAFKALSKGDLKRKVVLRKDDLLMDEADVFNAMVFDLGKLIGELKADNSMLLDALKKAADEDNSAAAKQLLESDQERIQTRIDRLAIPEETAKT